MNLILFSVQIEIIFLTFIIQLIFVVIMVFLVWEYVPIQWTISLLKKLQTSTELAATFPRRRNKVEESQEYSSLTLNTEH